MRHFIVAGAVATLGIACVASTSSTVPNALPPASVLPDACAGDAPWLVSILGDYPDKSDSIHVDRAARDPQLGPLIARGELRDMDGNSGWLQNVSWSSQEAYEYFTQPATKVIVARQVTGKDPRTLGDVGASPGLGNPVRLPSGVIEYPTANPGGYQPKNLFVFPDATWVIVDQWMESRFRAVFSGNAQSPPLPPGPPDTYIEYCFPKNGRSQADGSKSGGVDMASNHWAMRGKLGQLPAYELAFTFDTPDQAAHEEAAQRQRCTTKKCGIVSERIEGRVVKYVVR